MAQEIEVKYRLSPQQFELLREKLLPHLEEPRTERMEDTYFSSPTGKTVRIRNVENGAKVYLTAKDRGEMTASGLKTRNEYQVLVQGSEALKGLLEAIGCVPKYTIVKERTSGTWITVLGDSAWDVCLDMVPSLPQAGAGYYLELELLEMSPNCSVHTELEGIIRGFGLEGCEVEPLSYEQLMDQTLPSEPQTAVVLPKGLSAQALVAVLPLSEEDRARGICRGVVELKSQAIAPASEGSA